jgi:hypothetical protein
MTNIEAILQREIPFPNVLQQVFSEGDERDSSEDETNASLTILYYRS